CFFFQAEDGIRDPLVTGVQTCALPISRARRLRRGLMRSCEGADKNGRSEQERFASPPRHGPAAARSEYAISHDNFPFACSVRVRSEERRVGKECRSGRAASE